MPEYEHICTDCGYEWEAEYSIKDDPPKTCPKCGKETAKRLISCKSKGVVELTGNELKEKLKEDAFKMKKEISSNENFRANFYGEESYQKTTSNNEKVRKEQNYMKRQFRRVK